MINYPNKKSTYSKPFNNNNSNKGMDFEDMINRSNDYYLASKIAYINKRPTSVKIMRTSDRYHIEEAIFVSPSTLDYVGTYNNRYIDFEAKETINTKGFPTANIAKHQLEAIKTILSFNGICFVLIYLKHFNEIYLIDGSDMLLLCQEHKTNIPYEIIKEKGHLIKEGFIIPVDYIKVVKEIYFNI